MVALSSLLRRAIRTSSSRIVCMHAARALSSQTQLDTTPAQAQVQQQQAQQEKPQRMSLLSGFTMQTQLAVLGGGVLAFYGFSTFLVDTTFFFIGLSPKEVGLVGFALGFGSASAMACTIYAGSRAFMIRPETVYRLALRLLQSSDEVKNKLGGAFVVHSELKAYRESAAGFAVERSTLAWKPAQVQMLFSIEGSAYSAIATVEAVKRGLQTQITFCGVDVMNAEGDRVLVAGDEKLFSVKDQLRELVSFRQMRAKP